MINLVPLEVKEQVRFGRRNIQLRWYVGLALVTAATLSMVLIGADIFAKRELKRLDEVYATTQKELEPVKTLNEAGKTVQAKLNVMKQLFAKETNYVALLVDIEKTIVPGAQLQQLELNGDESKPLEMRFSISDKLIAATLRNSLETSDRFKFVDIQDISESETEKGTEIIVTYKLSYEAGKSR